MKIEIEKVLQQLKLNAVLVAPIGDREVQSLVKFRKGMNGEIFKEDIVPVRFVRMLAFDRDDELDH